MKAASRLFFDASVFIAAAGSPSGASTLTLTLCRQGQAKATSSRLVLVENPDTELEAWQHVYAGLSDQDIAEIENMAVDRSRFMRQEA